MGKSLVIGTRVGHSVSVYADSFGYAHIYSKKRKYPDIRIFPISQHKHNVYKARRKKSGYFTVRLTVRGGEGEVG